MVLRDAGIPGKLRPPDIGLVVMEPGITFPRERPRLRPRLFEADVRPNGAWGWEFEQSSPCVLALGGEEAEEVVWLLVEVMGLVVEEEELTEFLACCCCADGCSCCWVALL